MISLNLKLLPVSENPAVLNSNAVSEKSYQHLLGILGWQKCKKHPSFKNVINIVAREGKDPEIEVVKVCCSDFLRTLSAR
jgi:hypothetical protein